jgi:hypothetical protein
MNWELCKFYKANKNAALHCCNWSGYNSINKKSGGTSTLNSCYQTLKNKNVVERESVHCYERYHAK